MIRLKQIKINVNDDSLELLLKKCIKKFRIAESDILNFKIHKKSIDARHKPDIYYVYDVDLILKNESKIKCDKDILKIESEKFEFKIEGLEYLKNRPVIIGTGPAGLFCGYMLAKNGYKPILIERGENVEERIKTVNKFWEEDILNENSNVQFGEGGAGTFSDGKLNTLVKDPLFIQKEVFEIFVENGAPEEILYENKPHIGTDLLVDVVKNIRNKILSYGGEILYNKKFINFECNDKKIKSIELESGEKIETDVLILAIGHSSRDTFRMLFENKLEMTSKPFAIGVRIQHEQSMINESQYGSNYYNLKAASYKLTHNSSNRGIYTFCMCPGGYVVNSSSVKGMLAINGMSYHKRDSKNANSAVIVTINKNDFGDSPLSGMIYQEELERKFYNCCNGKIPVQLYGDFKNNITSTSFKEINPIFKGKYEFFNIKSILPEYISESLIEGIDNMGKKLKGFDKDSAIIAGIETRTSSPIKIIRDENFESNIKGIYPCGEGAGYAGGITSSAMDGIKVASAIAKKYKGVL